MSLLGGGNAGRQPAKRSGFQGAVAGAGNVAPKSPSHQRRSIDINKLRNIQSHKKTSIESYKLNANGKSRFRLVMPLGDDSVPLVGANRHWLPYVNEEGKDSKRPFYCYEQFGLPCPICYLRSLLLAANDESLKADADTLRASNLWAAYIINRDYLVGADDPITAQNDLQDKVVLFNTMSTKIADAIIGYLEMRAWGDASDPDTGYDFEVEGKPTAKTFNGYKISDYALSPYPRDYSPRYSLNVVSKLKPLSEVITYSKVEDLRKILDPILVSISEESEEGIQVVSNFQVEYERMLRQINAGPGVLLPVEEEEPIEVYDNTETDYDAEVGEENDTSEAGAQPERQDQGAQSDNAEVGAQADGNGESGSADPGQPEQVPDGGLTSDSQEQAEESFEAPAKDMPVMPPKPAASSLIGKLQAVGRK